jgi:hypothetical protein
MPRPDIHIDLLDKRNESCGVGMGMQVQAGNYQQGEEEHGEMRGFPTSMAPRFPGASADKIPSHLHVYEPSYFSLVEIKRIPPLEQRE